MELKPSKEFVKTVEEFKDKDTELGKIGYEIVKSILDVEAEDRINRMADTTMHMISRDCSIANDLDGTFMPYMQVLLEKLSKCFEEVS